MPAAEVNRSPIPADRSTRSLLRRRRWP